MCTERDFECDINYYRDTKSDTCTRVEASAVVETDTCEDGSTFYTVQTGYRRVAGNTCIGGVSGTLDPETVACSSSFGAALYYLLAIVFFGALGYVIFTQKDTIEEFVKNVWSKN